MSQVSQHKERALVMLGNGAPAAIVAQALGVTESAISQMLADEEFAKQVSDLRYKNLTRQTALDDRYTALEEKLVEKVEKLLPLMTKPRDVVATLTAINNTKRRGAQVTSQGVQGSSVVSLTIPVTIAHKFVSNVNNQVIEVQDDTGIKSSLVTASSSSLDTLAREVLENKSLPHDAPKQIPVGDSEATLQERLATCRSSEDRDAGSSGLSDIL